MTQEVIDLEWTSDVKRHGVHEPAPTCYDCEEPFEPEYTWESEDNMRREYVGFRATGYRIGDDITCRKCAVERFRLGEIELEGKQ